MRIVGLTGGISSGKSTVSAELQSLGVPIVDADKIAREAARKGTWGWKRVVATFGQGILQHDGEIDRAQLGEIIFNDPAKRKLLNRALQPCIAAGILLHVLKQWIAGSPIVVLDVPLLFEAKINRFTNPVVVVWVERGTQEERLMLRDGCSREQAQSKIESQLPLDWKADHADKVINNNRSLEDTKAQVGRLLLEILSRPPTWKELLFSRTSVTGMAATVVVLFSWKVLGHVIPRNT